MDAGVKLVAAFAFYAVGVTLGAFFNVIPVGIDDLIYFVLGGALVFSLGWLWGTR